MIDIKPRLAKILDERGLTQMALAKMTGVPQSAISRFDKNGQHKDEHLFLIARALGITVEDLFEVNEKEQEG